MTSIKASWEYKIGAFLLKTFGYLLFAFYVLVTATLTYSWGIAKWVKTRPLSELATVVEKGIAQDNPHKIIHWIGLRPEAERNSIMEILEPRAAELSPFVFLQFSKWKVEEGKIEEALFWRQYALYRARFDALRCGSNAATENLSQLLSLTTVPEIQELLARKPELVPQSIRKVLAYDAKYPAANNPAAICDTIKGLEKGKFTTVEQKHWPAIRHTLRLTSEAHVKEMEKELQKKP